MSALKLLSEYYSDDQTKTAIVYKTLDKDLPGYMATVKSDTGSTFSAHFETEDDAEEFAEQWVIT
jgi:hypothetical protein